MRRELTSFRSAFPDWLEEVMDFVAEDDMVAGRFRFGE
jgi:predicted ester cyclase